MQAAVQCFQVPALLCRLSYFDCANHAVCVCYAGRIGCDLLAFEVAEAEGAAAEAVGAAVVALEVVAEEAFVLVVAFELAVAGAGLLLFVDTLFVGAEAAEEVVAEGDADVVDGGDADVVGEGDADLVPEGVAVGAAEGDETEEDEGPAAATESKVSTNVTRTSGQHRC
jgi:hypothetical protein